MSEADIKFIPSIVDGRSVTELIEAASASPCVLIRVHDTRIDPGQFAFERFESVARETGSSIVYSDYFDLKDRKLVGHPTTDYQPGSIRDDFNFGSLLVIDTKIAREAIERSQISDLKFAGLYALRLAASRLAPITRIPEPLYTKVESDTRKSGEKQFDYVDPRNRAVQIEMEQVATDHLAKIGALLDRQETHKGCTHIEM